MSNNMIYVNVAVNGKPITIPDGRQQPIAFTTEQRTYVPIREIFEHLEMGFNVEWESGVGENPKGTVTATNSNYIIKMTEGASQLEVNSIHKDFPYGVAPQVMSGNNIVGGSFMIPLRGVFENIGCTLVYEPSTNTANVVTYHDTYYRIKNASGKYLTYLPSLADDDRISVSDLNTESPDLQIWKIEPSSTTGKYWVKPVRNTSKAMNVYQSSNLGYPNTICYVYDETKPYPDNIEDTSLNFELVYDSTLNSFYTQKIKWISETATVVRYLTCNGENTYWSTDDNTQIWILEPAYYPSTFQVKDNVTYKIAAYAGSATPNDANNSQYSVKYLTADTMNGSSTDGNGRRVFLSNSTSNNTWKIKFSGNKAHIIASNYPSEGLNYYYKNGLGNAGVCDTIPFEGNSDSFMEFLPLSVESHIPVCKIHLVRSDTNLYLTADDNTNGSSVSWDHFASQEPEKQLWYFLPVSDDGSSDNNSGSSGGNNNISGELSNNFVLPYNINQKYFDNLLNYRCAGACAMAISMYYRNVLYTGSEDEIEASLLVEITKLYNCEYFNDSSKTCMFANTYFLLWDNVYGVGFNISNKDANVPVETIYDEAVNSINHKMPLMIHYYTSSGKTHWVIPIGYDSSDMSKNIDTLIVYDPSTRDRTYTTTPWTLAESRNYNMKDESEFQYGYVTSYKNKFIYNLSSPTEVVNCSN